MSSSSDKLTPTTVSAGQVIGQVAERLTDADAPPMDRRQFDRLITQLDSDLAQLLDVRDRAMTIRALSDLFSGFAPFRTSKNIRKVTFFGSARFEPDHPEYQLAKSTAHRMSELGWDIVAGGGPGIMAAAAEGAHKSRPFGVKVDLPHEPASADPSNPNYASMQLFFPRKLQLVRPASAIVASPGGFGTLDEMFEVLTLVQTGKGRPMPFVLLDAPGSGFWKPLIEWMKRLEQEGTISAQDLSLISYVHTPEDAANAVTGFYRNYHSRSWHGETLVIRTNAPVTMRDLSMLNDSFPGLPSHGTFTRVTADVIGDRPGLDRIAVTPRGNMMRLVRPLIDTVNSFPSVELAHERLGVAGNDAQIALLASRKDWFSSLMNGEAIDLYARGLPNAVELGGRTTLNLVR